MTAVSLRWRPPYQIGKTVHVHAKHYKHNEDGSTAPGACGNDSVPLSHSGNIVTRIGIHTQTTTAQLIKLLLQTDITSLTLLHSERPKLYTILAFLSAIGLTKPSVKDSLSFCAQIKSKVLMFFAKICAKFLHCKNSKHVWAKKW